MLNLPQLFFRKTALFFLAIFLCAGLLGYMLLRQMEIRTHEEMLRNTLFLLEKDFLTLSPQAFVRRIQELRKETGIRVTVIDRNGKVRYESDRSPLGMENHAHRPEILQAWEKGWGSSVRHSHTLDADMLYLAHRLGDRTLRIAYSLEEIRTRLWMLWFKALLFWAGVIVVLYFLSLRFRKEIKTDLNSLRKALDHLLEKDFENVGVRVRCCKELEEIGRLIQKVAKRLAKRERQKAKYTRKLKTLTMRQSDIISAISHEFKNPVAAIMGYAQSLQETKRIDPRLKERFLGKIHANAEKISLMIDRLALAIKLENRSFTPKKSTFDLCKVLENIQETLRQKYRDREIFIECNSVVLEADRDMIEHALLNLAENALKYSEDEIRMRCDGTRVEVIDRGMGIEASNLEKITKKFYRVDRLSWNNSIGVGLYIVKYILKLHDTELEIESEVGRGSSFGFSLEKLKSAKIGSSK